MTIHNTYIPPQAIYLNSRLGTPLSTLGNHARFDLRNNIVVPSKIDCCRWLHSGIPMYFITSHITIIHCIFHLVMILGLFTNTPYLGAITFWAALWCGKNIDLADAYLHFVYDPVTFLVTVSNTEWGLLLRNEANSILPCCRLGHPRRPCYRHSPVDQHRRY